jgi:hypothetical protein
MATTQHIFDARAIETIITFQTQLTIVAIGTIRTGGQTPRGSAISTAVTEVTSDTVFTIGTVDASETIATILAIETVDAVSTVDIAVAIGHWQFPNT